MYSYDEIIVTSMYFNPIKKQLTEKIGITPTYIKAANKNLLKENMYPFEDKQTLGFANDMLLKLADTLRQNNLQYFIDFGMLLEIVRDQQLIAWDDDIDLTCYEKDFNEIISVVEQFIKMQSNTQFYWRYSVVKDLKGNKSSIVLSFEDVKKQMLSFSIDIWLVHFSNDQAIQTMNKCDARHFLTTESILYKNFQLDVPKHYEAYLEHPYGDWKTPQKDTTFADYPFAFED